MNINQLRYVRVLAVWALAALLTLAGAGVRAESLTTDAATRYITDLGNRAVSVLAMKGDPRSREGEFTHLMLEAIDFEAIAMATLGRLARTVSDQEKREFTELFAAHIIDATIKKFGDIQIVRFRADEARKLPNGDIKVHAVIARADGDPLAVDWRVHMVGANPKINDIEFAGYSLTIHFRGEFERNNQASVAALIRKLQDLNKNSLALNTVQRELK